MSNPLKKGADGFSKLLIIFLLLTYLKFISDDLRYAKYMFPFIVMFFAFFQRGKTHPLLPKEAYEKYINGILLINVGIFGVAALYDVMFLDTTYRLVANIFFVISPLLTLYFLRPFFNPLNINRYFNILFWGSAIGYILEQRDTILSSTQGFNLVQLFIDSESETESNIYPFVFAFLFIYALLARKSLYYMVVSFIFILLGSKRIVILGIVFVIGLLIMGNKFISENLYKKLIGKLSAIIVLILYVIIYGYFQFAKGAFDTIILHRTGQSADQMAQGRQQLYNVAISKFNSKEFFTGVGVGTIDLEVENYTKFKGSNIKNLHSEILRNFLELGAVLFTIWIFVLSKRVMIAKKNFYVWAFFMFALLTDNILIYMEVTFAMYFVMILLNLGDQKGIRHYVLQTTVTTTDEPEDIRRPDLGPATN